MSSVLFLCIEIIWGLLQGTVGKVPRGMLSPPSRVPVFESPLGLWFSSTCQMRKISTPKKKTCRISKNLPVGGTVSEGTSSSIELSPLFFRKVLPPHHFSTSSAHTGMAANRQQPVAVFLYFPPTFFPHSLPHFHPSFLSPILSTCCWVKAFLLTKNLKTRMSKGRSRWWNKVRTGLNRWGNISQYEAERVHSREQERTEQQQKGT